jgi:hypothetical protein
VGLTPLLAEIASGRALPCGASLEDEFWEAARREGMQALVADALLSSDWPGTASSRRTARAELAAADAQWALRKRDTLRVLDALAAHDVRPVLIKGAALACTHYPRPHLRPRLDTDLLIAEGDVSRARRAFESLGAVLVPHVTGRLVMPQFHYDTRDRSACVHSYDVHWKIVVPPRFANALSWDEIAAEATALPDIPKGRSASAVHALLLACVHRAAHHGAGGPLIWLHDVHLLCERMVPAEEERVYALASARRIAAVVSRTLADSHAAFGGAVARRLAERLGAGRSYELTASSLRPQSLARAAVDDLRSLPWRDRMRMLKELLAPGPDYMRATYAAGSRSPLALLYLRRIVRGARRWSRL